MPGFSNLDRCSALLALASLALTASVSAGEVSRRDPGTPAWQVDMVTATAGDHSTLLYAAPDAVCYAGTTPSTVSLLR